MVYGSQVKPIILAGLHPWVHKVVMEAKEHIFIFLPIIAFALAITLSSLDSDTFIGDAKVQACSDNDCLHGAFYGATHVPDGSDHIQCWTYRDRGLKMKEPETFIASAAITIFLTGCIIIAHEVSTDFRQSFVALTGNHWISLSVIAIVLFVFISGLLMGSKSLRKSLRVYNVRLWSTAVMHVTLTMILGTLIELIAHFLAD
jgi:hypothetical protein